MGQSQAQTWLGRYVTNSLIASLPLHKVTSILRSSVSLFQTPLSAGCICQFLKEPKTDSRDSSIIEIFTAIETFRHTHHLCKTCSLANAFIMLLNSPTKKNSEQVRPPPPREQRTDMCQKKASGGLKETLSDVTVKEKRPKKKRVCVG